MANIQNKTTLNFAVDLGTGQLVARRLRVKQALIVAASLMSRLDNARDASPSDLRARFAAFGARLASDVEAVSDAYRPASDSPPPQPPAEVLALVSAEDAISLKAMNRDIDVRVGSIMKATQAHAHRDKAHPKGAASRALQDACFSDGLNFLKLSGPLQWLAVQERFEQAPPDVQAAAQTLGVDDILAEVNTLNAWFGRLLNITEAPDDTAPSNPTTTQRQAALDQLHDTFADLLALSFVAWPGDHDASSKARLALVSPYLSAVQAASDEIGLRMRTANQKRDTQKETNP